jgi:hypothetical protein
MRQQCDHRSAHDAATDQPTGERCTRDATHRITWEDGRYSLGCADHLVIDPSASVKPTLVTDLAAELESALDAVDRTFAALKALRTRFERCRRQESRDRLMPAIAKAEMEYREAAWKRDVVVDRRRHATDPAPSKPPKLPAGVI